MMWSMERKRAYDLWSSMINDCSSSFSDFVRVFFYVVGKESTFSQHVGEYLLYTSVYSFNICMHHGHETVYTSISKYHTYHDTRIKMVASYVYHMYHMRNTKK